MAGSKIRLYGSTSGYVELEAPAVGDDGVLSLPTAADGFGAAGIGSNVVSAVKTDAFTTLSGTFTNITGLSVTITPSSATAKVLVVCTLVLSDLNGGSNNAGVANVARASTSLANFVSSNSLGDNQYNASSASIVILDAPGTASAVTYNAQVKGLAGATACINRSRTAVSGATYASSITAIEVAV